MVALPTPALAATASIDSASAVVPPASSSITAAMIASSARTERGRPGPLRSGWAGGVAGGPMGDIVSPTRGVGQRHRWSGCACRVAELLAHQLGSADDQARHRPL